MIPLDSPEWRRLQHAYGPASDIPDLLRQLAANPCAKKSGDEPWHSLWSALCHQGDVYTASYAAVPHIVDIALNAKGADRFRLLSSAGPRGNLSATQMWAGHATGS